jgi:hypothetical protein
MDPARGKQFGHLANAEARILRWAAANAIPLVRIEYVVPFAETDVSATVWVFYDTDLNVRRLTEDGTDADLRRELLAILGAQGYPPEWLSQVGFTADSHENVERNYDGSYFLRLR